MQQPFDEYLRRSINLDIEQGLGRDILLMAPLVPERRFIDPLDGEIEVPRGDHGQYDEEFEPPIAELAASRARYCAELAKLLTKDIHDLIEGQVFQNRYLTAETFLSDLTERFGLSQIINVKRQLFAWISGEGVSWMLHMGDPPEIMWAIAGTDERWTEFAALAQRVVGMTPSEVEGERMISIQWDLMGTHRARFG
jgi:hypothetical protein